MFLEGTEDPCPLCQLTGRPCCRRALEQAETEARKQTLLKPMTPRGLNSPIKSPHKGYRATRPAPQLGQVDLPNIMKVFNQVRPAA